MGSAKTALGAALCPLLKYNPGGCSPDEIYKSCTSLTLDLWYRQAPPAPPFVHTVPTIVRFMNATSKQIGGGLPFQNSGNISSLLSMNVYKLQPLLPQMVSKVLHLYSIHATILSHISAS